MKRFSHFSIVFLSIIMILQVVCVPTYADSGVELDSKHFPDAKFLECVKKYDTSGDNFLSEAEKGEILVLNCSNKNITSLEGINYLDGIPSLKCGSNNLTSLELNLPHLQQLECDNNKLTSLDLSKLTMLRQLKCDKNQLTELDVSNNRYLQSLTCNSNKITNIKFCTNCIEPVTILRTYDNKLSTLDISALNGILKIYADATLYNDTSANLTYYRSYKSSSKIFCYDTNTTLLTTRIRTSCSPAEGGTCTDAFGAAPGQKVSISAEPKNGYKFVKWQEEMSSSVKDVSTNKTYSFEVTNTNRKFIAVFEVLPTSTPTTNPSNNKSASEMIYSYLPSDCVGREHASGFVYRLYDCTFGRLPDDEGRDYWYGLLNSQTITGGQAAKDFIKSPEFISMNYSDEEFIKVLYTVFFNREPDSAGMEYWIGKVSSKEISRNDCVDFFINSQEWADMCAVYGIRSGTNIMPKVNVGPSEMVADFTENLYKTALNRDPDCSGMAYWALLLSSHRITGEEVGLEFFLSKELQDQNISNEEFVKRLYITFMGREGEPDGMNYWIDLLNGGTSRRTVVLGFTRSEEYLNRCIEAKILPYRY